MKQDINKEILAKIRKLQALADSAGKIGSIAEADIKGNESMD
jgi:hypothetical protein